MASEAAGATEVAAAGGEPTGVASGAALGANAGTTVGAGTTGVATGAGARGPRHLETFQIEEHLDRRAADLAEEVLKHEHMEIEDALLAYAMLERNPEPLELLIQRVSTSPASSSLTLGLLEEAEQRIFYLEARHSQLKAQDKGDRKSTENLLLYLRTAICDSECDPDSLLYAIKGFGKLPIAVRESPFGRRLFERASGLQRLWAWRRTSAHCRELLVLSQESSVRKEFEPLPEHEGPAADHDPGELWQEAKGHFESGRLLNLVAAAKTHVDGWDFDIAEGEMVVRRLEAKLEKRRAYIFRVDALLAEMEAVADSEASSEAGY